MGQVVGTPAFMPPEQAEGRLDRVGVASDVFSLGATLYCLLTGHAPYGGTDVLAQARRGEVVPARQQKRSVPAALEAVRQGNGEEAGRSLPDREGGGRGGAAVAGRRAGVGAP
jgi:serine/threonine protein kinase